MRQRILIAILLFPVVAASGAAMSEAPSAHAQRETTIPFLLERGSIYVEAFVEGQGPFRFEVDTGASGAGRVDLRLVEKLHLRVTGTTTNSDLVNTANISTVSLKSLRIGSLQRHDV